MKPTTRAAQIGRVVHSRHTPKGAFFVVKALEAYFVKHKNERTSIFMTDLKSAKTECDRQAGE